jgi:hypothetical protein
MERGISPDNRWEQSKLLNKCQWSKDRVSRRLAVVVKQFDVSKPRFDSAPPIDELRAACKFFEMLWQFHHPDCAASNVRSMNPMPLQLIELPRSGAKQWGANTSQDLPQGFQERQPEADDRCLAPAATIARPSHASQLVAE